MANPDRARGLTPVYHQNGGSWNNALAVVALPDDADEESDGFFIGQPVNLAATNNTITGPFSAYPLVVPQDDEMDEAGTDAMWGVIVGIGRPGETNDLVGAFGPWNPDNLTNHYVSAAEVETDPDGFVLYCAPALGWVFEGQTSTEMSSLGVGNGANISNATTEAAVELGNTTTGRSTQELVATETHPQYLIVGFPEAPDNDMETVNNRIHVVSTLPWGAQGVVIPTGSVGTE